MQIPCQHIIGQHNREKPISYRIWGRAKSWRGLKNVYDDDLSTYIFYFLNQVKLFSLRIKVITLYRLSYCKHMFKTNVKLKYKSI